VQELDSERRGVGVEWNRSPAGRRILTGVSPLLCIFSRWSQQFPVVDRLQRDKGTAEKVGRLAQGAASNRDWGKERGLVHSVAPDLTGDSLSTTCHWQVFRCWRALLQLQELFRDKTTQDVWVGFQREDEVLAWVRLVWGAMHAIEAGFARGIYLGW
jgi:hypothetical protein